MELGIYSFVETRRDPKTGQPFDLEGTFAAMLEQGEAADKFGLDVFGLGEHHRPDYAVSAPAVALAAVAARTKRIKLTSAVTVLSSDDPVRVYQQFATLDLISNHRAEIMVGRGSFVESYPLFGQSLNDYDELFAEKLDLLLKIRAETRVTWKGKHRPALQGAWRLSPHPRRLADLDRCRRHAAIGGARRHAWLAAGAGDHRRRSHPLLSLRRSLSPGARARRPRTKRQASCRSTATALSRRRNRRPSTPSSRPMPRR